MTIGSVRAVLGCLALGVLAPPAGAGDDFSEARERYLTYLRRPSLEMRTRGRDRFARTGDVRALRLLARGYARTIEPKDHEQYLIASVCADGCRDARHVTEWRAWRIKHNKARDAWLWYRAIGAEVAAGEPDAARTAVLEPGNVYLRAAALAALAHGDAPHVLRAIATILREPPAPQAERAVLIETCAAALCSLAASHFGSDEFRAAALALIGRLSEKLPDRTTLVVVRHLARMLRSDKLALTPGYWRALLLHEEQRALPPDGRYARSKRPRYFGIEASGTRVAYVLDLSDSMLTPLTDAEKGRLRGPVTGRSEKEQRPEEKLPWNRIHTRFDAAREYTKLSLRGLGRDVKFAIIVFGSKASPLKTTTRLIPASKANIARACRELDGFRAGPRSATAPHGSLLGYTNMHGALRRAFKIHERGLARAYEYVDERARNSGVDTVFLLSDGTPSWDDWGPVPDTREPEDAVGDPESGVQAPDSRTLEFCGPYWNPRFLIDDLERLNLFRHVEIHCIGLGEASRPLLQSIARVGLGQVRVFGR